MDLPALLELQSGVIARRQVLACGLADHDVRRMLRRREWALVHPRVYVDHTGPPTWLQRAWAAVLTADRAALSHESAIRATDGPGKKAADDDGPIHIAVDRARTLHVVPPGVVPHYVTDLAERVLWNASPPRVRIEHALLDLAAREDTMSAVARLSRAVQARRTTAARVLEVLAERDRIPQREVLVAVLTDIAEGTCSALEHAYLHRVERAHGLPVAERQVVASSRGPIYRDVEYRPFATVVELDGRTHHDTARARDRDLDRDLDAAVDGRVTIRLGWGQVYGRPCETAPRVARILQQRGWDGVPTLCPDCSPGDVSATRAGRRPGAAAPAHATAGT